MIALVKNETPITIYYHLLAGDTLTELWEGIKDTGLARQYYAVSYISRDREAIKAYPRFDAAVKAGSISKEEFCSYCFSLGDSVFTCCGLADSNAEAGALLFTLKTVYLAARGAGDYDSDLYELLRAKDRKMKKLLEGPGMSFRVWKPYRGRKEPDDIPTLQAICLSVMGLKDRLRGNPEDGERAQEAEKVLNTVMQLLLPILMMEDIPPEDLEALEAQLQAFRQKFNEEALDEPVHRLQAYSQRMREVLAEEE